MVGYHTPPLMAEKDQSSESLLAAARDGHVERGLDLAQVRVHGAAERGQP